MRYFLLFTLIVYNMSEPWPIIGVVGCGTIAAAVVEGLCKLESPPARIILCPRSAAKTSMLASTYGNICSVAESNQAVVDASEVVLVGLRTQVVEQVLAGLQFTNQAQQIVTMTSCIDVDKMAEMAKLPVANVAKAVPLPAVATHRGITVTTGQPAINERIFSQLGGCQPVKNEYEMQSIQVMTCMMGPVYKFLETASGFMISRGVPSQVASQYTARCMQTIMADALDRCPKGREGFTELVKEQTPGGLNETNISDLADAGVFEAYERSLQKTVDILSGSVSLKKDDEE